MQKVFADRKKHDKTTTKAAGCGIANSATDEKLDKVDKALAIAEVAMVMKSNQEKQFKQMMELFKEEMKSNVPGGAPLQAPAPAPTQPKPRKVCPHCKRPEANAADRPANWKWKPTAERQSTVQS